MKNGIFMKKAVVLLFDGVEELEAVAPIDILRRAGADVAVAAVAGTLSITGRSGLEIKCDAPFADVQNASFDVAVLAGGPGTDKVLADARVVRFFARHNAEGKIVAAICAAPVVLKAAGALEGRRCTAHTSRVAELENCDVSAAVVRDGNVITSRGAGTAVEFALEIVSAVFSEKTSKDVARAICFMG